MYILLFISAGNELASNLNRPVILYGRANSKSAKQGMRCAHRGHLCTAAFQSGSSFDRKSHMRLLELKWERFCVSLRERRVCCSLL